MLLWKYIRKADSRCQIRQLGSRSGHDGQRAAPPVGRAIAVEQEEPRAVLMRVDVQMVNPRKPLSTRPLLPSSTDREVAHSVARFLDQHDRTPRS